MARGVLGQRQETYQPRLVGEHPGTIELHFVAAGLEGYEGRLAHPAELLVGVRQFAGGLVPRLIMVTIASGLLPRLRRQHFDTVDKQPSLRYPLVLIAYSVGNTRRTGRRFKANPRLYEGIAVALNLCFHPSVHRGADRKSV